MAADSLYFQTNTGTVTLTTPWVNTAAIQKEGAIGMRALYKVFVVNPSGNGKVIYESGYIIARSPEEAKNKDLVNIGMAIQKAGMEADELDILADDITAPAIRPRKETKEVKIVK